MAIGILLDIVLDHGLVDCFEGRLAYGLLGEILRELFAL